MVNKSEGNSRNKALSMPRLDNFYNCKKEFEELLAEYGNELAPRIIEYEVEQCEFPVEVLNEIRAIYAHIYRASIAKKSEDIVGNIKNAKAHSKRAVLDCYKYLCVLYDGRYQQFFKKFGYINWHKSGLSDDIAAIDRIRKDAVSILKEAKITESTDRKSTAILSDSVEVYRELYKEAYEKYIYLMEMLKNLEEKIMVSNTTVSRFPAQWVAAACVLGIVVGVCLGVVL